MLQYLKAAVEPEQAKLATAGLAALWQVLIPAAEREMLVQGKVGRLLVIPDGPLARLPFEALVVDAGDDLKYLLDSGPPIQYAASATILVNLAARQRMQPDPSTEPVLTVGDPVYGEVDPDSDGGSVLDQVAARTQYVRSAGSLSPLPYSGWETAWVADVFGKCDIGVAQLRGAEATERNVRGNVSGRRIVHFACHGLADQRHGNLFGALALTPGSSSASPEDDGMLTLPEIYSLDMRGSELAVLSACNTNYGPQQRGEGVWALSRGFLVAGSRRVVASNWLVDDEAAASLVSYFCGALADAEQQGRTPDCATSLQAAKQWIRKQPKWQSPYYWASFVLIGPQ